MEDTKYYTYISLFIYKDISVSLFMRENHNIYKLPLNLALQTVSDAT